MTKQRNKKVGEKTYGRRFYVYGFFSLTFILSGWKSNQLSRSITLPFSSLLLFLLSVTDQHILLSVLFYTSAGKWWNGRFALNFSICWFNYSIKRYLNTWNSEWLKLVMSICDSQFLYCVIKKIKKWKVRCCIYFFFIVRDSFGLEIMGWKKFYFLLNV